MVTTAPNPIVASTDAGLVSLRRFNIPATNITSADDFRKFLDWAKTSAGQEFKTLAIDDLSEFADIVLREELAKTKHALQAYGKMAEIVMAFCRELRDWNTGQFVYMIAKLDKVLDATTGGMIYGPMFPGRVIAPHIPYLFDELYFVNSSTDPQTGAFQNSVLTRRNPQYEAKTRSDTLAVYEPAHLQHIFTKIAAG